MRVWPEAPSNAPRTGIQSSSNLVPAVHHNNTIQLSLQIKRMPLTAQATAAAVCVAS